MRRTGTVVVTALCLLPFLWSGCFITYNLYRLKAKGWGDQIVKASGIVQEVGGAAAVAGFNATSKEFRDTNLPKLDEAKGILTTVAGEIEATNPPGSLKDAHENLKNGVAAFIDAITAMTEAITMGDLSKKALAEKKKAEAESLLSKAKAALTGK